MLPIWRYSRRAGQNHIVDAPIEVGTKLGTKRKTLQGARQSHVVDALVELIAERKTLQGARQNHVVDALVGARAERKGLQRDKISYSIINVRNQNYPITSRKKIAFDCILRMTRGGK